MPGPSFAFSPLSQPGSWWRMGLLLTCALLLAGGVRAQRVLPRQLGLPTQYVHHSWQKQDGLPQNLVSAIVRARSGYLWLGTQEGLVRFDGVSYTTFRSATHEGLASDDVMALLEDRQGSLWIGTRNGLSRYADGRFTAFTQSDGLPNDPVRALHEDAHGVLWVGTLRGLARIEDGVLRPVVQGSDNAPRVLSLASDAGGRLWVGTHEGLKFLRGHTLVDFEASRSFSGQVIRALHVSPEGTLWVGTEEGLLAYRAGRFTGIPEADPACKVVSTIQTDLHGMLWIGTIGGGLCQLNEGRLYNYGVAEGLSHSNVSSLYPDAEGSLWIGTEGGGLNRLRRGKFVSLSQREGLSSDVALSVLEDTKGAVWIGTEGGSTPLNRLHDGVLTQFGPAQGLHTNMALSLLEDRQGTLWVGTFDGGLCRFDGRRFSCLTSRDGLLSNNVYALLEDHAGRIWIGTENGLNIMEGGVVRVYAHTKTLTHDPITALHETRRGDVWVGTLGAGLVRIRGEQARPFTTEQGLSNPDVLTLLEDPEGTLWVGTFGGGLCRLREGEERFRCYTSREGLFDDNVLQLLDDGQGAFWMGSNRGIVRLEKRSLDAFDAGQAARLEVSLVGLSVEDGLKNSEVNGGLQPSAMRSRDGRLWFSTMGGVAVLDPAGYTRYVNDVPPPVHIERVRTSLGRELELGVVPHRYQPEERDFRFTFATLSLTRADSVRIQYKLEGYDRDWVEGESGERSVHYSNLSPGVYTLRVRAANPDGVWNEEGDAYRFEVQPYLHETWWFFALCALLVLGAGVGLFQWRVRALRTRQRELESIVSERTAALREHEAELKSFNTHLQAEVRREVDSALAQRQHYEAELVAARDRAEESARLKSAILDNMSHEIRTPIAAILGFSQILAQEVSGDLQEFVTYIDESGKRLLSTLNGVLDLSRYESEGVALSPERLDAAEAVRGTVALLSPLAQRKAIGLDVRAPQHLPSVLDRVGLERVVTNLLGNAIKFTDEGSVTVELDVLGGAGEQTAGEQASREQEVTGDGALSEATMGGAATGEATMGEGARGDERLVLRVRDTGVGISPSFLPELFEAFKQESGGVSRSHLGSGLGLTLTKRLVEGMGGEISVESEKGVGSVFTVILPRYLEEPALSEKPVSA